MVRDKCLNLLTEKINTLYDAYEKHAFDSYVTNKNEYDLVVRLSENNVISFLLLEKDTDKLIDDVHIDFEGERSLYEAMALRIFAKALGNVMVHKLGYDTYYNNKHKPYILVIVEDEDIIKLIDKMLENQMTEAINLDNQVIKRISNRVQIKTLDWPFLSELEDRAALTKELFRRW